MYSLMLRALSDHEETANTIKVHKGTLNAYRLAKKSNERM